MSRYATPQQFYVLGLPEESLYVESVLPDGSKGSSQLSEAAVLTLLESASSTVDRYIAGRVTLPLAEGAWGMVLTTVTCHIAAFEFLASRGDPLDDEADNAQLVRYRMAIKWLESVRDGAPVTGILPGTPPGEVGAPGVPFVFSSPPRGIPIEPRQVGARSFYYGGTAGRCR